MKRHNRYRAAFEKFHRENPKVYELFERFALQAARSGRERFGSWAVWNRMRWFTMIETNDPSYKLNNNHIAYYARLFMERHPQYDGFFETRRVIDDGNETPPSVGDGSLF